jgi:hypothetical protein
VGPFRRVRGVGVTAAGLAGSILLHVLLIASLVLELSLPQSLTPDRNGAGASALRSLSEPVMTVVFINELSSSERRPPDTMQLASRGLLPVDLPLVILSPDPFPTTEVAASDDSERQSAPSAEAAGDQTQHALLYGRYLGQIQARIERAWVRPRTDIGASTFSCRVRVEQDGQGNVAGVALDHCNGTERWQHSLLSAIRTASPLPAPPDPSIYANRLCLSFRSDRFRAGGPTEGFEPESVAARDDGGARQSFEQFASGMGRSFRLGGKQDANVVHLTIIGSASETPTSPEPTGTSGGADTPPQSQPQ